MLRLFWFSASAFVSFRDFSVMAKFKAGDLVVCVNVDRDFGCIDLGELTKGKPYVVKKMSGNDIVHVVNNKGHEFGYYECRFAPAFAVDCCVKCVNATGSDLTKGRFYTVRDITGGGALVLHGNDSRPYRSDRFELADNSEWVSQTIREKDAAQKEFEAKTLTIESHDFISVSPPNNNSGWNVEIDYTMNPMSPVVKFKKRQFQCGDTVSPIKDIISPPFLFPTSSKLEIKAVYPDGDVRVGNVTNRIPSEKFRLVKKSDQCIT